jgi:hypothetical protein
MDPVLCTVLFFLLGPQDPEKGLSFPENCQSGPFTLQMPSSHIRSFQVLLSLFDFHLSRRLMDE